MIAGHVALSYRMGLVKDIPTWLDTFHLVALSGFYAHKFLNYRKIEKKASRIAVKFSTRLSDHVCRITYPGSEFLP